MDILLWLGVFALILVTTRAHVLNNQVDAFLRRSKRQGKIINGRSLTMLVHTIIFNISLFWSVVVSVNVIELDYIKHFIILVSCRQCQC